MTNRTAAPPLTRPSDASWTFDLADAAESMRLGVTLITAPTERSMILTLAAERGSERIPAIEGLVWSQKISAQFIYFPGPDRTVWFSPSITFAQPVDRVRVTALHWPSQRPLVRQDVRRLFLQVPEGTTAHEGVPISALYLGSIEAHR